MKSIKVTCRFPITMQQSEIAGFCSQFGLTYERHTAGGEPNNYWLVVQVAALPAPETIPVIKQSLTDFVISSLITVEAREN